MITNTLSTKTYEKNLLFRLGSRSRGRECRRGEFYASIIRFNELSAYFLSMEQIKSNFKTVIIMETKINLDKPINLSILNTKDFVLWFKQEIKNLVEDQKISKRDRKDVRHPCPEKRKYNTYEAYFRVLGNRETLRIYYALYYTLRHNKDFDWTSYSYQRGKGFVTGNLLSDVEKACKPIDPGFDCYYDFSRTVGDLVYRYAEKVVREGAEKALCNY